MKKSYSFSWVVIAVLGALALFGCIAVSSPLWLKINASTDEDFIVDNSTTNYYLEEDANLEETTDLSKYYFHDGYEIVGGELYCEHTWQDWIMTKSASLTSPGSELRYCNKCLARQTREFGKIHGSGERTVLDVECILQMPEFPNGCEVVSLTIVLNFLGYSVTTNELVDNFLPRGVFSTYGDDPFYYYLGDPRNLGVGCYAPCIVNTADNYFDSINEFRAVTDISGRSFEDYKEFLNEGTPIIFWGTTYMDRNSEIFGTVYVDEKEIIWRSHSHCFVMIGYTDTTYIFCDPLRGVIEYPKEDVEESHALVYEQACVIQ